MPLLPSTEGRASNDRARNDRPKNDRPKNDRPKNDRTKNGRTKNDGAKTLFLVLLLALIAFLFRAHAPDVQATDFPDFYCASRMVIEGHGHQLYDAELQRQFQMRYAGRMGTLYIHPPFETVLYLVVAWLPLRSAYFLWCLLNLGFLVLATRVIGRDVLPRSDWRVLLAASLLFVPVLLTFLQGQDSILLFLLVTLAFAARRKQHNFSAGCWLGLGLFKFQLALPLIAVLALRRGGRNLLRGFALVALALAALSAAISGWTVFTLYPKFLLHLSQQPFEGVFPAVMANIRGLVQLFLDRDHALFDATIIVALSAAALLATLVGWRDVRSPDVDGEVPEPRQFDLAFAQTVLFALLVSYHLNPHDLSLLLLPLVLLLGTWRGEYRRMSAVHWLLAGLLAILFLPPLHLLALRAHVYAVVGLPVCALFLIGTVLLRSEGRNAVPLL